MDEQNATIAVVKPPKVSWQNQLNQLYRMANRQDESPQGQLSLITAPVDHVIALNGGINKANMKFDQNVTQNVYVTSSQQISSTDSGVIRTTSQQFSKVSRVQTVNVSSSSSSTSTRSFGDLKAIAAGDLKLAGIEGQIGSKDLSTVLSPVMPQNVAPGALVPVVNKSPSINDKTDLAIEATLNKTMETFQNMFQKQREQFMQMFPQFKNLRAECVPPPEIITETIVQPDGTILVIEKQQSRRVMQFSQKTTIVNGVVQSTTTRAVMVYGGPNKGYEMKMEEVESTPVDSETEDDDDDRRSVASEFSDTESPMVRLDDGIHQINAGAKKKLEKAWCAAEELVETERRYVAKLHLLDGIFRSKVEQLQDKSISSDKSSKLFSNVASLLIFHNVHLLPALEDRLREWHDTQKICDVMCRLAPYLKMYSEYTNNYKKAAKVYDDLKRKNKRFASIVNEIEALPECDNLPLNSHLICPVQRVARYHLLMQEYLKNLPDRHTDRSDAELALEKVKVAANHANDMMKKLDKYKDVIEIQESLGNQIQGLVTPTRELIKKGQLTKISGRTGDRQDRILFLFDDLLLLCSDRRMPLTKYKLRAVFPMEEFQVLEGDNLEVENTFYVRCKNKTVELQAKNGQEKSEWMETLWNVMQNHKTRRETFGKTLSPVSSPSSGDLKDSVINGSGSGSGGGQKCCAKCQATFRFLTKEYVCRKCDATVCKKCSQKVLLPEGKEKVLVCNDCAPSSTTQQQQQQQPVSNCVANNSAVDDPKSRRKSMLAVKPNDDCVWKGSLEFRSSKSNWITRYFALHSDFVLYCFKDEKDTTARTSLLVPGCKISMVDPKQDSFINARDVHVMFKLTHQNRAYYFKAADENDMVKWMAALDLASQAALPKKSPSETEC